jgi:hypothetical protein
LRGSLSLFRGLPVDEALIDSEAVALQPSRFTRTVGSTSRRGPTGDKLLRLHS